MRKLKEISEQIRERIIQFVEEAEVGESVLDKTVVDMKKRISRAKELVAAAIAEEESLKRAYQEAVDTAEVWTQKASAALQDGDIAAARDARQREQQQTQRANDYEQQIRTQRAVITSLKTTLNNFYQRFQNTVKRAETLHHSQKQAETRRELHKLLAEIEPYLSDAFEHVERKIKSTEAEAELWKSRHLRTETQQKTKGDASNLDRELAKLKEDLFRRKKND